MTRNLAPTHTILKVADQGVIPVTDLSCTKPFDDIEGLHKKK